jgi:virginiamycin B lyase
MAATNQYCKVAFAFCVFVGLVVAPSSVSATSTPKAETHEIREYATPSSGELTSIRAGPDGALWFTEYWSHIVGRITTAGVVTEFPLPSGQGNPGQITAGSDGALWFTEQDPDKIGRMTTGGVYSSFALPPPASGLGTQPDYITAGPDGALWFTETTANSIGRMTTDGTLSEFPLSTPRSFPLAMTVGPDGDLWFGEANPDRIGRITTAGDIIDETPLPHDGVDVSDMTFGADGALWFAEGISGSIGRMTTDGSFSSYPLPSDLAIAWGLTVGPDGNLWFADDTGKVGRITLDGNIAEFPTVGGVGEPEGMAEGPDGGMWFTGATRIGRVAVAATPNITAPSSAVTLTTALGVAWSEVHPAWIANYDVRRAVAPWSGILGTYTTWLTGRSATTAVATGAAGHTYCFQVRAHDIYGDTSGWSTRACSAIPLTAAQIAYSSGWTKSTSSAYFGGVAMHTRTHGATATRTGISAKRLYLIATECPTCGTITFKWNGTALKAVNLYSPTPVHRRILSLVTWTSPRTGTLSITVTSTTGKTISLEGIGVFDA